MENHPMNPENFANSVQTVYQVIKEMDQKSQEYFLRFVNASSTMESDEAKMQMEVYMSKASVAKNINPKFVNYQTGVIKFAFMAKISCGPPLKRSSIGSLW